jgi:hypothetical protein
MFIATAQAPPDAVRRSGNELALNTHDAPRSSERSRRSGVTASYKHAARAPRKLDISDWVRVPVEKGSNQPLVPSVAAVRR